MPAEQPTDAYLVVTTFPNADVGADIAGTLVRESLVACVNLIPGARSFYWWQGEVCDDSEVVGLIKTTRARLDQLRARFVEVHPYDCPELIAFPIADGHPDYLRWIHQSVNR